MTEVWKPVKGYPSYAISNLGEIRDSTGENIIPSKISAHTRYRLVRLSNGKTKPHQVLLHKLVMFTFGEDKYREGKVIEFIDGNRANCRFDNLRWSERKNVVKKFNDPLVFTDFKDAGI